MPRKRTEWTLTDVNQPDPISLSVSIGLDLPCMKKLRRDDQQAGNPHVKDEPEKGVVVQQELVSSAA